MAYIEKQDELDTNCKGSTIINNQFDGVDIKDRFCISNRKNSWNYSNQNMNFSGKIDQKILKNKNFLKLKNNE